MIINHNMASLNTYRSLSANNANGAKSLEKLSSGLRINRAGDDAAGLAISEKMRGQIRGLDQASRNAQDGISLIQTAEGAMNETHSILQRMRELAVQSSNDTNTAQDRKNIQDEVTQLNNEINRISGQTEFNTKKLTDGSMGSAVNTAVANISTSSVLKVAGAPAVATNALTALQDANGNSLGITATDTFTISYVKNGVTTSTTTTVGALTVADLDDASYATTVNASGQMVATAAAAGFANAVNGLTITVKDSTGTIKTAATNALSSFSETTAAADVRTDGSATFQIGANQGQNMQLSIENVSAAALGVEGIQVGTQVQADVAVKVIDTAITKVSQERSKLGSIQNRLEHTINNLGTSNENLTAAESRIRDVDMAKEMMTYQKNNILSQAATAMLAQANQQPQGVLQLLR
jgi:flagellin